MMTQGFHYKVPDLQELVESFSNMTPNYISIADLSMGFHQIRMDPESSKYTAFDCCFGTMKFLKMPMGLKTAANTLQMIMDKVLKGLTFKSSMCYLDDLICASSTFSQHLQDVDELLSRLRTAGLKLGPKKCDWAKQKCIFLGHEISKEGVKPPPNKVEKICDMNPPRNIKALRRCVGMFNWFRKFIPNYSTVAAPMMKLMKQNTPYKWTKEQQNSFDELKRLLSTSSVLSFPRYDIAFRISVDTSAVGTGYMLYQIYPENEFPKGTPAKERIKVVKFGSKSLTRYQSSYGPSKLEMLGILNAVLDCAPYVRGRQFFVECDHEALRPMFQKKMRGKIYERWLGILQQFDMEIEYKPAAEMVVPDALSRCKETQDSPATSPDDEDPYFPYMEEKAGEVRLPGGTKMSDMLLYSEGSQANNIAKLATEDAYDGDTEDTVRCTNVKQCKRRMQHRINSHTPPTSPNTSVQCQLTKQVISPLPSQVASSPTTDPVSLSAETLYNSSSSTAGAGVSQYNNSSTSLSCNEDRVRGKDYPTSITAESLPSSVVSTNSSTEVEVDDTIERQMAAEEIFSTGEYNPEKLRTLQRQDLDLQNILNYLIDKKLPKTQREARLVVVKCGDFALFDGILFHTRVAKSRRTKDMQQFQMVLPSVMQTTVIRMYHECALAGHGGVNDTTDRLKEHYYFDRLADKVYEFVKSCHECQIRKMTKAHTKTGIVAYPTPTKKFQVWEADLYGPLPAAPGGERFLFTAVCLFSKFLKCIPLKNKDTLSVAEALTQLVCEYGTPETLISDQGKETMSKAMDQVCTTLHIPQEFTPSFVHHCLGAVERTHSTLAERLTPYMKDSNWLQMIPPIVFSINNSVNATLGYSPYEIIYLDRPTFPLSMTHRPNLDTLHPDMHHYMRQHMKKLDTVRREVMQQSIKAKGKMMERVNKDINPLSLTAGDYVYMLDESKGKGQKLKAKYTGPYVVEAIHSPHMVTIRHTESNKVLKQPVHCDRLKMAYVREPNPLQYFHSTVTTSKQKELKSSYTQTGIGTDKEEETGIGDLRRSNRKRKETEMYGIPITDFGNDTLSSDTDGYHAVKRILGVRRKGECNEYLVQVKGEPAQNAFWAPFSYLNKKAQAKVLADKDKTPLLD